MEATLDKLNEKYNTLKKCISKLENIVVLFNKGRYIYV
ncbi:MAG: hypothetical protein K0Q97_1972 [Bacillota bacterium]|jgi:hypothetical protein|nr:hypothetical protein [Bacillota bacterium]